MILTSMVCACLMGAQQPSFVERFDELTLVEAVELLISEGYQNGFASVGPAFTPNEPIGELKQSFANGLRQIRLSSGLTFEQAKSHISVTKTSIETAVSEYRASHYESTLPSLIGDIRAYVGKSNATVVSVSFSGKTLETLSPWLLYVILDKNKKWRIDAATPKIPIIALRLRPGFFVALVGISFASLSRSSLHYTTLTIEPRGYAAGSHQEEIQAKARLLAGVCLYPR